MTTYNSYEEAKIANPDSEIYKLNGVSEFIPGADLGDVVRIHSRDNDAVKCKPASHCMTVERFLADGHKLVEGDLIIQHTGAVAQVCDSLDWNMQEHRDNIRYILRAAALKPRDNEYAMSVMEKKVRVEYVRVEDKQAWTLVKEFEEGVDFYTCSKGLHTSKNIGNLLSVWRDGKLHRRIETPIEWWEDAKAVHDSFKSGFGSQHFHRNEDNDTITISGEYTREQLCDIARELLEQGE
ncbi:putative lipocalin family protein [Vibrio phage 199E37-1]|nr:putative lipocalin family protein [Vibrio phage 199E37-1]